MIIDKVRSDNEFAVDVLKGLTSNPKTLPSKYFYDANGDALFQKIMDLEEYYLTKCEYDIFQNHKEDIMSTFIGDDGFDLIEMGAGNGYKTKVLLEYFSRKNVNFSYWPLDISPNVLNEYVFSIQSLFPEIHVEGICAEYFEGLEQLKKLTARKKVLLFLGANIGNFNKTEAFSFLEHINDALSQQDLLMIGFDLKKNPKVILDAYNDRSGVTKAFNLNLLKRINRELRATFDLKNFEHFPTYCPVSGDTKSFLISMVDQTVEIEALNIAIEFRAWEPIQTETSKKYDLDAIYSLAKETGFKVIEIFFDPKGYFADTIWQKV